MLAISALLIAQSMDALKQKYDKQEVYITMRDGVRFSLQFIHPKSKSATHPMLLNRTPYDIEPGGPESFNYFVQVIYQIYK